MSPHRVRHSGITEALEIPGGDVRAVQKLSRHAKLETLMIYDDARANASAKSNSIAGISSLVHGSIKNRPRRQTSPLVGTERFPINGLAKVFFIAGATRGGFDSKLFGMADIKTQNLFGLASKFSNKIGLPNKIFKRKQSAEL